MVSVEESKLQAIWRQVPVDYYEQGIKKNLGQKLWHQTKYLTIRKLSEDLRPEKVLDIGSNGGNLTAKIAQLFPKAKVCGVDVYEDVVRYAQQRYPKIRFLVADAQSLPFKAKEFDLIFCLETLEHIAQPRQTLREIQRCLKDNGQVIISMDSGSTIFNLIWFFWTRFGRGKVWRGSHLWKFNRRSLMRMIEEEGFQIEREIRSSLGMVTTLMISKK